MSELARRYAKALYEVSPDEAALHDTAHTLMDCPPLWEALCAPTIRWEEKCRVYDEKKAEQEEEFSRLGYLKQFYQGQ